MDGREHEFELTLEKDGESVTGSGVTEGHFRNDPLTLAFHIMDYSLTGSTQGSTLMGEVRKDDGTENGRWSGIRMEPQEEAVSSSLVFLYEYQKAGGKERIYSVDPCLPCEAIQRSAQPICRVWRNPSSVMALDYKAKAVQTGR